MSNVSTQLDSARVEPAEEIEYTIIEYRLKATGQIFEDFDEVVRFCTWPEGRGYQYSDFVATCSLCGSEENYEEKAGLVRCLSCGAEAYRLGWFNLVAPEAPS